MAYNFLPNSILLNATYFPYYEYPKKIIKSINEDDFDVELELDNNGILSIINLKNNIPFIDIYKYDNETKDWFFYNDSNFPFRLIFDDDNNRWNISSVYGIPDITAWSEDNVIKYEYNKDQNQQLRIYSTFTKSDDTEINLYKGTPFLLSINDKIVSDITNYETSSNQSNLNNINPDSNFEFYYDFKTNRIITNQNLDAFSPDNIILGFYKSINEISVKARLESNSDKNSVITPVLDYYILKLKGQSIRS